MDLGKNMKVYCLLTIHIVIFCLCSHNSLLHKSRKTFGMSRILDAAHMKTLSYIKLYSSSTREESFAVKSNKKILANDNNSATGAKLVGKRSSNETTTSTRQSEFNLLPLLFQKTRTVVSWTDQEIKRMVYLRHHQRLDWDLIALALQRSASSCKQKYQVTIKSTGYWEMNDYKIILNFVVELGENWTAVADRSNLVPENCKFLYNKFLKNLKIGPWSEEEDEQLKKLYFENSDFTEISTNLSFKDLITMSPSAGLKSFAECANIPWRNISHTLNRSSVDCRRRFMSIAFSWDFSERSDIWLDGETRRLLTLVERIGPRWNEIGRELGRKAVQCSNAYTSGSAANIRLSLDRKNPSNNDSFTSIKTNEAIKGTNPRSNNSADIVVVSKSRVWSLHEDEKLLELVKNYGNHWKTIGSVLNRTNVQCFQRYQILKYSTQRSRYGWSLEETSELFRLVKEKGAQWTEIGRSLGRTPYVCRAAYKRIVDKAPPKTIQMPRKLRKLLANPSISEMIDLNDSIERNVTFDADVIKSLNFSVTANSTKRQWTKEEDEYLRSIVSLIGRRWSTIAEEMGRSPEDVMLRYDFKIFPKRSGYWTREEDRKLIELVGSMGPRWAHIGDIIGRTGSQCSMRYRLTLDPRLKWKLWTEEEDEQLISLRDISGYNWAMISAVLDRAGSSCRYRYMKVKNEMKSKTNPIENLVQSLTANVNNSDDE